MYLDLEEDPFRERGRRNKKKREEKFSIQRTREIFSGNAQSVRNTRVSTHTHTKILSKMHYIRLCVVYTVFGNGVHELCSQFCTIITLHNIVSCI